MTKAALDILSKDQDGFSSWLKEEESIMHPMLTTLNDNGDMIAFDEAVKTALDFAKRMATLSSSLRQTMPTEDYP